MASVNQDRVLNNSEQELGKQAVHITEESAIKGLKMVRQHNIDIIEKYLSENSPLPVYNPWIEIRDNLLILLSTINTKQPKVKSITMCPDSYMCNQGPCYRNPKNVNIGRIRT